MTRTRRVESPEDLALRSARADIRRMRLDARWCADLCRPDPDDGAALAEVLGHPPTSAEWRSYTHAYQARLAYLAGQA